MICDGDVCLRPISINDTDFILEMRNDLEDSLSYFSDYPLYDFEHTNWLKTKQKDMDMIIEYKKERAGRVRISNIDYRNQKCEFGIQVHKDFRVKGIGYRSSMIIINYVFQNLPIRKIYLHTLEDNQKAIRLFQKLGFTVEGVFKEEIFKDGKWRNVLRMALMNPKLKNEPM